MSDRDIEVAELEDSRASAVDVDEKRSSAFSSSDSKSFKKDEAILARFGKKQQLRVRTP